MAEEDQLDFGNPELDGATPEDIRPRRGRRPKGAIPEDDGNITPEEVARMLQLAGGPDGIRVTLNKWNPRTNSYEQVTRYEDVTSETFPDTDTVGRLYGSGKYTFYVRYRDANAAGGWGFTTKRFSLGSEYDKYVSSATPAMQAPASDASMGALATMMGTMMTAMQANQQNMMLMMQQNAEREAKAREESSRNTTAMITALAPILGGIVTTVMSKQQPESAADKLVPTLIESLMNREPGPSPLELYREGLKQGRDMADSGSSDDKNSVMGLIRDIIGIAPMILDKTMEASKVKAMLKANPQARLLDNPANFQLAMTELEKGLGPEKARELVAKAGVTPPNGMTDHSIEL